MKFFGLNPNGLNPISSSFIAVYVSGSEALRIGTSENTFFGNVVITDDLVVQGRITAQEFYTEIVSSSVIYESGSTKFGDTLDDKHQFTGSVEVLGAITGSLLGTGSGSFSGSFQGTFSGDGSQLTGLDTFPYTGSAIITGSLEVQGTTTGSTVYTPGSSRTPILSFDPLVDSDTVLTSGSFSLSIGNQITINNNSTVTQKQGSLWVILEPSFFTNV